MRIYSKTCVRQPPLKFTLVVDVERWLSYKGTCHVILPAKLHDMYLYKTENFFPINKWWGILVVDVERWLSYKGTCHVILPEKLHDMYLYKTENFFPINNYLKSVSKVALLHRFCCTVFYSLLRMNMCVLESCLCTVYHV